MDLSTLVMYAGFALASYSVVGNDVIQTLGTYLSSNKNRPWWVLWIFAGSILVVALVMGYVNNDITYGRLDKIATPDTLSLWYLLPPLVLLIITRLGLPVSTTFLILTFFSASSLPGMLNKSLFGYGVAFLSALIIYYLIAKTTEKRFHDHPLGSNTSFWTNTKLWTVAQWLSTGFLWWQWLQQDLANIYIYLGGGKNLTLIEFIFSLVIIIGLLGFIFRSHGGAIQKIVNRKTNTSDIRSATVIDLIYGLILMLFKYNLLGLWEAKLPMSTTWVFLGLLGGREFAMRARLGMKLKTRVQSMIFSDLGKATLGLIVSVTLVILLYVAQGQDPSTLFD
ncbi:MAG: hypothetical protein R3F28_14045 [Candidatus Kapaibacterium sp.]